MAISLGRLAGLYYSQGRYSEAEPIYIQALDLSKRLLGDNHPDVATSLNNLSRLYYSQGRYSEAEPLYLQALSILLDRLGDNHPDTITVWQNFLKFLLQVVRGKRVAELSDNPLVQQLVKQMQEEITAESEVT